MRRSIYITGIIFTVGIFGLSGFAFANGGMMGGGSMMGSGMTGGGSGFGQAMWDLFQGYADRMGNHDNGALSQRRADRLQQARDNFFNTTRGLRADIKEKQSRLDEEQGKATPDQTKIARLQKELSDLRSEYDQEVSAYERETRDIQTESGDNNWYGYGRR